MRPSSSLAALIALAGFSMAEPNGWSKTTEASDSPTKLDDCGCWPIYQAMLRCQKLEGPNADTRECVCIPNPDGWYPSMDGCRTCLSSGTDEDFFEITARFVTQLFVSCTNAGGGVYGDGTSICASNYYREACVSLGTGGRSSWASFEVFESKEKGNSSYVLDIEEYGADEDTSTTTTSITATTKTATDSIGATQPLSTATDTAASTGDLSPGSSSSPNDASRTETGSASATTTSSSAIKVADSTTLAVIRGMMIAVAVGTMLM